MVHFSVYPKQNLSSAEGIIFDKQTVNQMTKKLLDHLPNLVEIRAKNCMLTKIDKDLFGRGKKLTNLKTLTLSKNQLTKLEDMMFARANQLETLNLVRNKIGVIEKDAFRGLVKLSNLDMAHNYLKNLNYDIFPDSEQLYYLDFSNNHLQEVDFDVFAGNQRYQSIKLNHNNIGKVHVSDDNYNVGMLDLSYNSLQDISPLNKLKNIFSMKASHNYNSSLTDSTNFIEEQIATQTLRYYNLFTKS
jgi:Leucine-rich repeat (LRR) protein